VARPRSVGDGRYDGILVVDKPAGPSSHEMVALVRRLTGVRRVGHGGTLDPFASGVLPIFVGRATRLAEYHMTDDKAYRALVAFGARSTTDDIEGELTPVAGPLPGRAEVEAGLEAFRGPLEQRPPAFSAVHVDGRRAYQLARSGETPELRSRRVTIHRLELVEWQDDAERPTATLELECSAGTYVRALARDLGEALGCGAYLAVLRRTASGPFRVEEAVSPDELRSALTGEQLEAVFRPPDAGLERFPQVTPTPEDLAALLKGQVVRWRERIEPRPAAGDLVRVMDDAGRLVAVARSEGGRLHPEKVLRAPDEIREAAASGSRSRD
jgi:tRNA pseudouridine55 synthase